MPLPAQMKPLIDVMNTAPLARAGGPGYPYPVMPCAVQIVVPGPLADPKIVRQASRARWGDLLRAGVEIYEYQPALYHCKLMVVDDLWTSIGSSNLDNRSFSLNDEANLNVLDEGFARQQSRILDDDLAHSRHITYEEWRHRPLHQRITEGLASLFGFEM